MTPRQYLHSVVWARRRLTHPAPEECRALLNLISPGDTCLDIGAHSGSWTVPLARRCRNGSVFAFEALPYYAEVLGFTLKLLRCQNVTVVNRAVMDRPGTTKVISRDVDGNRLTGRTHVQSGQSSSAGEPVGAISLDSYEGTALANVRFLKCDVEGVELLVLKGASTLLSRTRPLVFCEIEEDHCRRYGIRAKDVFGFFAERGYSNFRYAGASRFVPFDSRSYSGRGDVLFAAERDLAKLETLEDSLAANHG